MKISFLLMIILLPNIAVASIFICDSEKTSSLGLIDKVSIEPERQFQYLLDTDERLLKVLRDDNGPLFSPRIYEVNCESYDGIIECDAKDLDGMRITITRDNGLNHFIYSFSILGRITNVETQIGNCVTP